MHALKQQWNVWDRSVGMDGQNLDMSETNVEISGQGSTSTDLLMEWTMTESIGAGFLYMTCSAGSMLRSHKSFALP